MIPAGEHDIRLGDRVGIGREFWSRFVNATGATVLADRRVHDRSVTSPRRLEQAGQQGPRRVERYFRETMTATRA